MIELFALRFCKAYHQFRGNIEALLPLEKEHRSKPMNERVLSHNRTSFIAETALRPMLDEMKHLEFPIELITKATKLYSRLIMPNSRSWTAEALLDALTDLNGDISRELDKHKFFQVKFGNGRYLDNDRLLGDDVFKKFKTAREDIRDAGNCFATELHTASVFHLMRIAEHGLRRLAKRLRVQLTYAKKVNYPIVFADWGTIIEEAKNRIDTARKTLPPGKRHSKLEFYSDAADHCTFMKDIWRNSTSHTRKPYTQSEALAVFDRVRDFMQFLGRNL